MLITPGMRVWIIEDNGSVVMGARAQAWWMPADQRHAETGGGGGQKRSVE